MIAVPVQVRLLLFAAASLTAGYAGAAEDARTLTHEMKVQRATEAAIWAMPAVSVYDIELRIQRDLGGNRCLKRSGRSLTLKKYADIPLSYPRS